MDADYDPEEESKTVQQEVVESSSRVNRRRKSKFARALKKKKPVFNPDEKDFDSYFNEYYNLDFEDIVGGVPCRYKYRKVEPNDFGLSTEEVCIFWIFTFLIFIYSVHTFAQTHTPSLTHTSMHIYTQAHTH